MLDGWMDNGPLGMFLNTEYNLHLSIFATYLLILSVERYYSPTGVVEE